MYMCLCEYAMCVVALRAQEREPWIPCIPPSVGDRDSLPLEEQQVP